MIKSKKCNLCERPAFSKGLCNLHGKKSSIKKQRSSTVEKKEEKQERRNVYFEYHIKKCTKSEESGESILNLTRANDYHLIQKCLHHSLQDTLKNCIYLTFSEHERFDKLLFSLEFDKLEKEFKNSWDKTCVILKELVYLSKETTNL